MPASVTLGKDETGREITIGDIERRSGLYILGIQGSGKTTLIKQIIEQDMAHGHGVFFLDPHGDAIDDLKKHIPSKRQHDVIILDPEDETYSFGMNLLACSNPQNLTARTRTFAQAIDIFKKLFANLQTGELDILLNQYLRNSFFPLIANQGYTITEIPLFLRDKQFRDRLLQHTAIPAEVVDFWHDEFDRMPQKDQREEIASTRRRLNPFGLEYMKHIVGQSKTTLDFTDIMEKRKILFVKLSANLAPDMKQIIGSILISALVHAVRLREHMPEAARHQFCIFVDEFQNFASDEDFATLITEGRKFGVATTIAHQERYGQFADNKKLLGATDAAGNKIFFQSSVGDAQEQALVFAKDSPTETRLERKLVISQNPVEDILRGHGNPDIRLFVNRYLRYLHEQLEDTKEAMEGKRLLRQGWLDDAAYARADVSVDEMRGAIIQSEAVVAATRAAIRGAQGQSAQLLQLYERSQGLRHTLRFFDRFLTALMEGQIAPGQEAFRAFLIDRVGDFSSLPTSLAPVLELYLSLLYGHLKTPRAIPFEFAKTQGFFSQEVALLTAQAEEKTRQARQAHQEEYRRRLGYYVPQGSIAQKALGEMQNNRQKITDPITFYAMGDFKPISFTIELGNMRSAHRPNPENLALMGTIYNLYFWLHCYPEVATLLAPYRSAHFDSRCKHLLPRNVDAYIQGICERFGTKHGRNWGTRLSRLDYTFARNDYRVLFRSDVVHEIKRFLEECKEGALVILTLLDAVGKGRWIDFPLVAGVDPLDCLRLIKTLQDIISARWQDHQTFLNYFSWEARSEYRWTDNTIRYPRPYYDKEHPSLSRSPQLRFSHLVCPLTIDIEKHKEAQALKNELANRWSTFSRENPMASHWWSNADELSRSYVLARSYNLALGCNSTDSVTFPQPTITGAQEMVAALVRLQTDMDWRAAQAIEAEAVPRKQKWIDEECAKEMALCVAGYPKFSTFWPDYAQKLQSLYAKISYAPPDMLAPRALSANDREELTKACLTVLVQNGQGPVLQVVADFVQFCELLRRPENHIKVASTQYVETQVNTYTTQEMTNQMAQELINLPPRSAYAKVVTAAPGRRSVWKGKLQTLELEEAPARAGDVGSNALHNAIEQGILRERSAIEQEIRERQERWRRGPGRLPPPPTHTGGNNPPSLPSERAERKSKPPPTHYTPEEK